MMFLLGTHEPSWLADPRFVDVPLFVSRRRLFDRKTLPRAVGRWALDSGGFTELQQHGRWTVSPATYVAEVRRFRDEIGGLLWAAPQDWMCEPQVLAGANPRRGPKFAGTGLTVEEHIRRTVRSFLELRDLAPELPWIPVLQGWRLGQYLDCAELYERESVNLAAAPLVGVGTMCRRQDTIRAGHILRWLAGDGLRLHGFGLKIEGSRQHGDALVSADSLAWSDHATHHPPLEGHDRPGPGRRTGHKHCQNCPEFALEWRERVLAAATKETIAA
jgi:hypothetical protein